MLNRDDMVNKIAYKTTYLLAAALIISLLLTALLTIWYWVFVITARLLAS